MARRTASPSGRGLFLVLLMVLGILAVYDLSGPGSILGSVWNSVFPGQAPVEGVRDSVIRDLRIPR